MTLRLVKDDNGIVATGYVYDDGVGRNLTGATVALVLKVKDGTTHTVTCTADGDQTTNPGKFTATLTSTHLATDGKGSYEVQVTDGSAVITYNSAAADEFIIRQDLS